MCGIAGFWQSGGMREDATRHALEAMTRCIAHRGPDDDGVYLDAERGVALGFRRLAIIDLTPLGHQPMQSPRGRYWITFNGEIYNHHELRKELVNAGVQFRGRSDTEVLCAGLEVWGIRETFVRAAGMFGVAIWDAQERVLTLVRDRIGIKPVYVASVNGVVSWGSELKSIMNAPKFAGTINDEAVREFAALLYVPGPRTVFTQVTKLPPGAMLTIRDPASPLPEPEHFWSAEKAAIEGRLGGRVLTAAEGQQQLEQLLLLVTEEHMESDVPLGAFLSGGIDSSLVVALMTKVSRTPVKTYTIAFDSSEHDESAHAEFVAKHLGTDHLTIPLRGADALDEVSALVESYDEPFADSSQLPSLLVCRAARKHVTVVLTGDGGDELFAGYNRYRYGASLFPKLDRVPGFARASAGAVMRAIPGAGLEALYRMARALPLGVPEERLIADKVQKLGRLLSVDSDEARYRLLVSTERIGSGRELDAAPWALRTAFAMPAPATLIDRMLLADQLGYLPDNQMTKVDRASMAASLEARVPLLDHRVIELAWKLPSTSLFAGGQSKAPLRQLLYKHVPRELIDRPKTGFSVPLVQWLRGPLRPWAEERFAAAAMAGSPLDGTTVRTTFSRFLNGHDGFAASVWTSLMFESWRARWVS
jgi:asparagine synthase (glutamine-hydrolysing)